MYKLSQLTEDGSIMLHGQKIADTILYVNGDFVKNQKPLSPYMTVVFSMEMAYMKESVHMDEKYTVWMSISNVCMSPATRWESI